MRTASTTARRRPVRLDALAIAQRSAKERQAEAERWADLSRSTDFPSGA